MSKCRVNRLSYTVVNNKILRSKNLSCAATGLLCKVMSLPDDWDYTVAGLVSICKEGKTAINSIVKSEVSQNFHINKNGYDDKTAEAVKIKSK